MITTVRVRPVEEWCKGSQEYGDEAMAGQFVQIETNSMWWQTEDGERFRNWRLVGESLEMLRTHRPTANGLCEHMLEMD